MDDDVSDLPPMTEPTQQDAERPRRRPRGVGEIAMRIAGCGLAQG